MARSAVWALALCVVAAASACDEAEVASDTSRGSTRHENRGGSTDYSVVGCGAAIVDRVDPDWRRRSIVRGAFGLYGNGADLRTADPWGDSAYWTKIPVVLAAHRAATLRVSRRDRDRVRLTYGERSPSPGSTERGARGLAAARHEVRFEPCLDRAATAWPGGIALADRKPVHLEVRFAGQGWRSLTIAARH
jgi:hypothetical protein